MFCYFQIHSSVFKTLECFPFLPSKQPWEELHSFEKHTIPKVYESILSSCTHPTDKIKSAWEKELRILLEDEVRDHAVDHIKSTTTWSYSVSNYA